MEYILEPEEPSLWQLCTACKFEFNVKHLDNVGRCKECVLTDKEVVKESFWVPDSLKTHSAQVQPENGSLSAQQPEGMTDLFLQDLVVRPDLIPISAR